MLRKARIVRSVLVAAVGALVAYLFDPRAGRSRRRRLSDQVGGLVRHRRRTVEQKLRYVEGKAAGVKARLSGAGQTTPSADRVIVNEIKAALARLDYPTVDVNVDVVDGTATLRGQLKRPEEIREVRSVVAGVPGVVRVESYLHLPGTPAPNKAEALDASAPAAPNVVHHGA